jgi:endonuclease/exonuclease/phosphatase family metal-dependent hydrolase
MKSHAILIASMAFAVAASEAPGGGAGRAGQGPEPRGYPTAPTSDVLIHSPLTSCRPGPATARGRRTVRVATWNISAARYAPLPQIATELQAMQADVIALQEVDFRLRRSGLTDQPATLAAALGFHHVFAASIKWDGGDYGLALLTRLPLVRVERHRLDVVGVGEPRIVLDATVCANGRPMAIFNHHADVSSRSRHSGLAALSGIIRPSLGKGVLVVGDFNEGPDGPGVLTLLGTGLVDVAAGHSAQTNSRGRIDYVLADRWLQKHLVRAEAWPTKASDHHAVIAEFRVP